MVVDSTSDLGQAAYNGTPFAIGNNSDNILHAPQYDNGGEGVAYHDLDIGNKVSNFRAKENVDVGATNDSWGGNHVWLESQEWLEYTTDIAGGAYDIKFRVAPRSNTSGSLNIKLNDELLGKVTVTGTNGSWQTVSLANVPMSGGEDKILRIEANNGGDFNLNWMEFYKRPTNAVNAQSVGSSTKARSTDDFIDSIGVAAAIYNNQTAYNQFNKVVKPRLQELGVKHLRTSATPGDSKTIAKLEQLADLGIEFNFIMDPRQLSLNESVKLVEMFDGSVESVEGPNEWNHNLSKTYKGQSFPQGLKSYQADLYRAIKNDPDTSGTPVLAPSLSNAFGIKSAVAKLGSVVADANNAHNYPDGRAPINDQFFFQLPHYKKVAGANKPLISTETGYTNALKYSGGVSEEAAAIYLPRLLLTHYNHGFERTYIYELMNDKPNSASNNEHLHYGLLRADGSKKPGFIAVKNLIDILDNSDVAANAAKVPLGSLNYKIEGDMGDVQQTLLQKKDGRFYLALWQAVPNFDRNTKSKLSVPQKNLTVNFGSQVNKAAIYRPNSSANSLSSKQNTNSITVGVTDKVTLLEVTL